MAGAHCSVLKNKEGKRGREEREERKERERRDSALDTGW
jgi:hypothetical protein